MLTTNTTKTNTTNTTTTNTNTPQTTSTLTPTTPTSPFKRTVTLVLALVMCLVGTAVMFSGCKKDEEITVTTVENGEVIVKKIKKDDLVAMPNVVGMNKDEAVKTLENLGLVVELVRSYDEFEKVGSDCVIRQSKSSNDIVEKQEKITLDYNDTTPRYEFITKELEDGTLSLEEIKMYNYEPTEIFDIPHDIDGKVISQINLPYGGTKRLCTKVLRIHNLETNITLTEECKGQIEFMCRGGVKIEYVNE